MKRASLFAGLGIVVLVATIAWAAPAPSVDLFRWVKGGLSVGRVAAPPSTSYDAITDTRGAYFAWDFPAIGPGGAGQAGGHLDGPTFARTGVRVGDECLVSTDRSEWDGGWPMGLVPRCRVPSDGYLHLQVDYLVDDAGTVDPVDAGFYFRTFSMTAN